MALKPTAPRLRPGHPLNRGLVSAWLFTEGAGSATYDAAAPRAGILQSAPTWVGGRSGRALSFVNGSSQYITTPLTWKIGVPITVTVWIKTAGGVAASGFGNASDTTNRIQVHLPYLDNTIYWDYGDQGNGRISTSMASFLNVWTHITLVNDGGANGSAFKAIYINGILQTSGTANTAASFTSETIHIGDFGTNFYFNGMMDDMRFFNRVLPSAEINRVMRSDYSEFQPPRRMAAFSVPAAFSTYFPMSQPDHGGLLRKAEMVGY